uniref:Uncharacterized protein n=1 Tax=Anguilla anguilla TaxID=7936 RepID=A0A0E9XKX5_ANGAN
MLRTTTPDQGLCHLSPTHYTKKTFTQLSVKTWGCIYTESPSLWPK